MKSLLALSLSALLTCSAFANEAAAPAKPDLAKGQEKATTVCGACHMHDGQRGLPTFPILQGQHPAYLAKQLNEFKAGKRVNPIMLGMASMLTDEDIRNVTAYFGSKKVQQPGTPRDPESLALGQQIWRGGIAARQVPACSGCHGPNGAGIPAQYPRLASQHPEYLELQLNTFRSGERANSAQMSAIALRLTDKEIKALADYAATLH